ncbi:hypothetical protein EYZ11_005149 [Aspergillus tanneri]|uniref:Uncharacterized protein n=1 Tax=Aspergillus tanneri TaxID=1220188 RepID=A0A4S3JPK4_9EURO|nr:hypothetical protein EYZ11_005149 [Aspergillus tanneri]
MHLTPLQPMHVQLASGSVDLTIDAITPTPTTPTQLHIHLDEAFVHHCLSVPLPSTGTFDEARSLTAHAKAQFHPADRFQRGEWLLAESVASGVFPLRPSWRSTAQWD